MQRLRVDSLFKYRPQVIDGPAGVEGLVEEVEEVGIPMDDGADEGEDLVLVAEAVVVAHDGGHWTAPGIAEVEGGQGLEDVLDHLGLVVDEGVGQRVESLLFVKLCVFIYERLQTQHLICNLCIGCDSSNLTHFETLKQISDHDEITNSSSNYKIFAIKRLIFISSFLPI